MWTEYYTVIIRALQQKKVFEKLLRAYFIHSIYFPQFEYECIFATPKSSSSTDKEIKENVEILNNEVENRKFTYISNEDFNKKIINPILSLSKNEKIFRIHSLDVSNC